MRRFVEPGIPVIVRAGFAVLQADAPSVTSPYPGAPQDQDEKGSLCRGLEAELPGKLPGFFLLSG
jgi:hypothetical protein